MATRRNTQGSKKATKKGGKKGKDQVPPVIVKGGSIYVEFNPDFDDSDNGTKVKKIKHPHSTKITVVEVRDMQKKLLNSYTIPENLNGKCLVYVWDNS